MAPTHGQNQQSLGNSWDSLPPEIRRMVLQEYLKLFEHTRIPKTYDKISGMFFRSKAASDDKQARDLINLSLVNQSLTRDELLPLLHQTIKALNERKVPERYDYDGDTGNWTQIDGEFNRSKTLMPSHQKVHFVHQYVTIKCRRYALKLQVAQAVVKAFEYQDSFKHIMRPDNTAATTTSAGQGRTFLSKTSIGSDSDPSISSESASSIERVESAGPSAKAQAKHSTNRKDERKTRRSKHGLRLEGKASQRFKPRPLLNMPSPTDQEELRTGAEKPMRMTESATREFYQHADALVNEADWVARREKVKTRSILREW